MIRVLLNAAYHKNYKGVENILQNSNVLQYNKKNTFNNVDESTKNYLMYYYLDTGSNRKVLDLYDIACYHDNDSQLLQLLKQYNIVPAPDDIKKCSIKPLIMNCLSGNSDIIKKYVNIDCKNRKYALKIAIDCKYPQCVNVLIDDLYYDTSIIESIMHFKNMKLICTMKLLRLACLKKNLSVLKKLLDTKQFELNTIQNHTLIPFTLLDEVLTAVNKDSEYKQVALLLQDYGAKTLKQINDEEADQDDGLGIVFFS